MAKGQYSTIYGMLILALSFSVMLGLFVFSNQIKDTAIKNFGERILDGVSDKIQSGLVDMRFVANSATVNNMTYIITVPKRIGEQNYYVRGENSTFTIRTIGQRSMIIRTNISDLWDVTLLGAAFSQGGQIKLYYVPPATVVLS